MDFIVAFFQAHPECSQLHLYVGDADPGRRTTTENMLVTCTDNLIQPIFQQRMIALGPDFADYANWSFRDYEFRDGEMIADIRDEVDVQLGNESQTEEQALADLKEFLRNHDYITDITIEMMEEDSWTPHLPELTEIFTARPRITAISLTGFGLYEDDIGRAGLHAILHMLETKLWITKFHLGDGMFWTEAANGTGVRRNELGLIETFARSLAKTDHINEVHLELSARPHNAEVRPKAEAAAEAVLDLLLAPSSLTRLTFEMNRLPISVDLQTRIANALVIHTSIIHTDVTAWLSPDIIVNTVIPMSPLQGLTVGCFLDDSFHDHFNVQAMYGAVIAKPEITRIGFAPCSCLGGAGAYRELNGMMCERRKLAKRLAKLGCGIR